MFVYIYTSPDMFRSEFDHPQGFLCVLGLATKNVADKSPVFTPRMWLYICCMLSPALA